MWGPNTFLIPHISLPSITFPYISPYLPHTPSHFPTPPFIPLPTSLLPPPHPNTFSYYPHVSLHLLKVWRSYHVTKLPCGEVTMWRSYWQPSLAPPACSCASSPCALLLLRGTVLALLQVLIGPLTRLQHYHILNV